MCASCKSPQNDHTPNAKALSATVAWGIRRKNLYKALCLYGDGSHVLFDLSPLTFWTASLVFSELVRLKLQPTTAGNWRKIADGYVLKALLLSRSHIPTLCANEELVTEAHNLYDKIMDTLMGQPSLTDVKTATAGTPDTRADQRGCFDDLIMDDDDEIDYLAELKFYFPQP